MTDPAGIYCRLSLAQMGDTVKVDDQERICRELAGARGWQVRDELVWKDNNASAWKRNRRRPGWDAMLAAVQTGRIRNLVVYHGDRLVRQPYDLELLLNLVDKQGLTVTSPTGEYRLDVSTDRFVLRILTAKACLESDDLSRRKKTGFQRMARDGVAPAPAGRWGRGFGYDATGRTPVPAEAAAIREAAERVLGGETLAEIARGLTARGVRAVSGGPLTYRHLGAVLQRPRIAGLLADGRPGTWEPVLDAETFAMTGAVLRARADGYSKDTTTARYLLSGIARCWACGTGVRAHKGKDGLFYQCDKPGCYKVRRHLGHTDAYVTGRAVAQLNSPRVRAALAAPAADPAAAQIAALERRRDEVLATADRLADEPGADVEFLHRALASFNVRIAALREERGRGGGQRRLLAAHAGVTREQFDALPLHTRRAVVAALYEITLRPSPGRGGRGFKPQAIEMKAR